MAGQLWAQSEYGGYWSNQELSLDMHIQAQPIMRFRQFCDRDASFGANRGDTLLFNKFLNVDTEGGELDENAPFPKTGFKTIQSSVVAKEYGNSIPYTEKLERLSKFDTGNAHNRAIINDVGKTLNRASATQFRYTRLKYTPTGTAGNPTSTWQAQTTNTVTATAAASRDIQVEDVLTIVENMKSGVYVSSSGTTAATASPVPPYDDDGNYICICSVGFAGAIRRDSDFINASLYGDPERLFAGEIGRFHGVRFIEDNHILANSLGSGFKGEAVFFGAEAVKEIVVLMEEIRRGVPLDGGRDRSFYWYAIMGFKLIWEYTATTEPDNRIVHVTSSSITS